MSSTTQNQIQPPSTPRQNVISGIVPSPVVPYKPKAFRTKGLSYISDISVSLSLSSDCLAQIHEVRKAEPGISQNGG